MSEDAKFLVWSPQFNHNRTKLVSLAEAKETITRFRRIDAEAVVDPKYSHYPKREFFILQKIDF